MFYSIAGAKFVCKIGTKPIYFIGDKMDCRTAPEEYCKRTTENRLVTVSFSNDLYDGEKLTGTPVVVESTLPTLLGFTISSVSINTIEIVENGATIAIGHAVQFLVSGGSVGNGEIKLTVSTDKTPSQTLNGSILLENI